MPDQTTILSLPLILPAQAQKHVTHNEALRLLDVMVQLAVADRTLTVPPGAPSVGARHIVAVGATGAWAGQAGKIALWEAAGWVFFTPTAGWRAHVAAEGIVVTFDGAAWVGPADGPLQVTQLGVSATADSTNRLAVSAAAVLLTHAGAGHQIKVNKAAATDTAALLFQTGFSGRAEMGTIGGDDFVIKVSPDGTTFNDGVVIARSTGIATLPRGVRLPGGTVSAPAVSFTADPDTGLTNPAANQIGLAVGGVQRALLTGTSLEVTGLLTGTAVTQSISDTTANRLLKVADFGLGAQVGQNLTNIDSFALPTAFSSSNNTTTTGTFPTGATISDGVLTLRPAPNQTTQILSTPNVTGHLWHRRSNSAASWAPWRRLYDFGNALGTVSQTGGVPTGGLMERGSNANGEFVRLADGTQICTRTMAASAGAATTWTFPAAFVAAPVVKATAIATVLSGGCLDAAPSTTAATFSVRDTASARRADTTHLIAIGRWF